jgi:hypothetical protein
MKFRKVIGRALQSFMGDERAESLRHSEFLLRRRIAQSLDSTLVPGEGTWPVPKAFAEFAKPVLSRHRFLAGLHEVLQPRTYLEIGVNDGGSLRLSRSTTIGVDPDFAVKEEINCDVQLVRATSDEFFARDEPLAHFGGRAIDLAFIDGMHLAEFAYRDFLNVERLADSCGVVVLDDMLPRNVEEAARDRRTKAWAGDVFKLSGILRERRPDLVVLPVNTAPTGVLLITALDPASTVLSDAYAELQPVLQSADPQNVPEEVLYRRSAVNARSVLASTAWKRLVELRESGTDRAAVVRAVSGLRRIKRLG